MKVAYLILAAVLSTGLAAGALACLKKPVDPQTLRREIRRALLMPPEACSGDLN